MDVLLALVPPAVEALRVAAQEGTSSTEITLGDDGVKFFSAAFVMGIGAIGPSLAIGNLVGKGLDALGRNPEAQPAIQTNMILGLAFAEAIGIYALVVAIMIGFVF
jgi:F-type H+-transporting ATPase subunit c